MIGTIHSVANSFIRKYWLYLGLSPNINVMPEEDYTFYESQSLADLPTDDELTRLNDIGNKFALNIRFDYEAKKNVYNPNYWHDHIKSIIDLSTNYEIKDYERSKAESLSFIKQFVDKNVHSLQFDPNYVRDALLEFQNMVTAMKENQTRDKRLNSIKEQLMNLNDLDIATLHAIHKLLSELKNIGDKASTLRNELSEIWQTEGVYELEKEYIELLFSLAQRWRENFYEFKRERNLLDYNDMERYMLSLIDSHNIANEISSSYKYLFVDEFQDCSPIQVKIFDKLSDLMTHSYWVGDYKQAIYGFRGSDVDLVKAIVDRIATKSNNCDVETLDKSWRSVPAIVDLCNNIFSQTFSEILPQENIVLQKQREVIDNCPPLRYLTDDEDSPTIPDYIKQLIDDGVSPNDIAVICRTNSELNNIAIDLDENYNIPSNRDKLPVVGTESFQLVSSLLMLLQDNNDVLAKASIAYLTEKDYTIEHLINEKIEWIKNYDYYDTAFLNEIKLVSHINKIRESLLEQPFATMIETMIIELDLYNIAKQWIDYRIHVSCLNTIIEFARNYEQHCIQMGLATSITGFLTYTNDMNPACGRNVVGVQLNTYHSSKGLQWKHVILGSLDYDPADVDKCMTRSVFGIKFERSIRPSVDIPYPEVYIRVTPWIYGKDRKLPSRIYEIISKTDDFKATYQRTLEESNRLLYVGMTRPKDSLTLLIDSPKKAMRWYKDLGVYIDDNSIGDKCCDLFGIGNVFRRQTITQEEIENFIDCEQRVERNYNKKIDYKSDVCDAPSRDISPSHLNGIGKVISKHEFKQRISLSRLGFHTMDEVGNCIHQIYCGIEDNSENPNYIKNVIESYGLSEVLRSSDDIVTAWNNLVDFLVQCYGKASMKYHERPFKQFVNGQIVTGSIDLVWQTEEGAVIIDFKSCPMGNDVVLDQESEHYVGLYGGQLHAYASALSAAGNKVISTYIYYPVIGLIVELK
jgi:ATP-dependent exoDNAse (exonuclease V) beta subunit